MKPQGEIECEICQLILKYAEALLAKNATEVRKYVRTFICMLQYMCVHTYVCVCSHVQCVVLCDGVWEFPSLCVGISGPARGGKVALYLWGVG